MNHEFIPTPELEEPTNEMWNVGMSDHLKRGGYAKQFFKPKKVLVEPEQEKNVFPNEIISGVCGEFADLYSKYIEAPAQFLFFSLLACLGTILAGKLTLKSEVKPEPRLYILLLGESSEDRKSTALKVVIDFLFEFFPNVLQVCWGVGSAEGLQLRINESPGRRVILTSDEFKALVSKCKIDGSVLLPCINTLFESTRYESRTKSSDIKLEDAHLSILGASTKATYETLWTSQFLDIGFINRLLLIPATSERKFPIPEKIPEHEKKEIASMFAGLLRIVGESLEMEIDPEGLRLFENWYFSLQRSIHTKRLDTYGLRLMPLLALNNGDTRVTVDIVKKTISFLDWQKGVREELDPVDAISEIAVMEEKVRRLLKREPLTGRELKRRTHSDRVGSWIFDQAIKNLSHGISPEIRFNRTSNLWQII